MAEARAYEPTGVLVDAGMKHTFCIADDTECCYNCRHYMQHYILPEHYSGRAYVTLMECNSGFCSYPRAKIKKPADACNYFEIRRIHERKDG